MSTKWRNIKRMLLKIFVYRRLSLVNSASFEADILALEIRWIPSPCMVSDFNVLYIYKNTYHVHHAYVLGENVVLWLVNTKLMLLEEKNFTLESLGVGAPSGPVEWLSE